MDGLMSLINVSEYAGHQIKEWNIVQFSRLSSVLSAIAKEYKDANISWAAFANSLKSTEETRMLEISHSMLDSLTPFLKHAPALIAVSCNVKEKDLEDIKYTDGLVLTLLIMKKNLEHLNSFFVTLVAQSSGAAQTTDTMDSTR